MNPSILLLVPILLPLIGGAFIFKFRFNRRYKRERYVSSIVIINTIIIYFILFFMPKDPFTILSLTNKLSITFAVDGLSKVFAGLVASLWPLATFYAYEYMQHERKRNRFFAFYTMTYGVTIAIAFSANLVTLYLFYECLTFITLPLVMHKLDERAKKAGKKYLVYSIFGASLALMGVVFIDLYGTTIDFVYGGVLDMGIVQGNERVIAVVYLMMFLGFGVKAAIFPFHGWLPSAGVAPTPVTALLHAVAVVKSGIFAIMRVTYYSFGTDILKGTWVQYVAMTFAMITIVFGSAMAFKSDHLKKRLAYSTVSNLSYIVFAITLMSPEGLIAASLHMVFHGIIKICLFFCAGAVIYKAHTFQVSEMTGYGKNMPVTFSCFTIASLALMGVPPLAGFISKWKIALAAVHLGEILGVLGVVALLISAVLTAAYLMSVVLKVFAPQRDFDESVIPEEVKEVNAYIKVPMILLCVAMLAFGLFSNYLVDLLEGLIY